MLKFWNKKHLSIGTQVLLVAGWISSGILLTQKPVHFGGVTEEGYGVKPGSRKYFEYMRNHNPDGELPTNWIGLTREFAQTLPKKTESHDNNWVSRGPFNIGGRTRALAVDRSNPNILIAGGVTSGIWRSTDGGTTWVHGTTSDQLHSVSCILQDPRAGHELEWYYGTGEEFYGVVSGTSFTSLFSGDGIFKSTDGGISWNPITSTQSGTPENILQSGSYDFIWRMAIDPSNQNEQELYAAVYNGIIRSVDGGSTWQNVLGFTTGNSEFTDVMVTPEGIVYATFSDNATNGGGFYRSEDGITWTSINPVSPEIANLRRTVMAVNPQNTNEVYFLGETLNNGNYPIDHFLYKYTYLSGDGSNTGGSWENRTANLPDQSCVLNIGVDFDFGTFRSQYSYDLCMAHHPNSDVLFIGGINLHRGMDAFATDVQEWIGGYRCNPDQPYFYVYPNHHPDQHFITFDPSNPSVMYSTNDGGVYKTNDCMEDSVKWIPLNHGYIASQFYTVGFEQGMSNSEYVYGGMQDNGTWQTNTTDFNTHWKEMHGDDGSYAAMPQGAQFMITSSQNGKIMKKQLDSQGNLLGTERLDPTNGPSYLFINPLLLDPWNNQDLFISANKAIWYLPATHTIPVTGNYLNQYPDSNWVHINASSVPLVSGSVSCLDKPLINNDVIYYGTTQGKAFRLDNCYSDTPTRVNITGTNFPPVCYTSSIASNDLDEHEVLLSFSNYSKPSLFHSLDGGTTWSDVSGNLEQNLDGTGNGPAVYSVEIYPSDPPIYFAGTSAGLFSTNLLDSSNTIWTMEAPNTIGNVIVNMVQARPYDGLVAVGTHGNGVFTTHLPAVSGVGVANQDWDKEMRVFPTVFENHLNIQLPTQATQLSLRLFDLNGKLVADQTFSHQKDLRWNLPSITTKGMYILIITADNQKQSFKIIHE